jgi:hypothetical protein
VANNKSRSEGIKIIYEGVKRTDNTAPLANGRITIRIVQQATAWDSN